MKAIMLIALTSMFSIQETDAKDLTSPLSYVGNSKPVATCKLLDSDSNGVSVIEINHLVRKASNTPSEVKAFVGKQGKRLGVDSVAVSTIEKSGLGNSYCQTFYLSNSRTSYLVRIQCEWPSSVVVLH